MNNPIKKIITINEVKKCVIIIEATKIIRIIISPKLSPLAFRWEDTTISIRTTIKSTMAYDWAEYLTSGLQLANSKSQAPAVHQLAFSVLKQ